ncbi:MAG: hypothetical protein HDR01_16215 [Lachnospiraceae bacterium]|nr:hypothetical protein [Lachnospiraceae bacterium]
MCKTVNEHKFAFILCTNNDIYLQECFHYLNQLIIPGNYEVDILTIHDAASMASGYNEGMSSTDAKYKIYMHQDLFILNRYFLWDLLSIFQSDSSIGMIGMVGYPTVSIDGMMWHSNPLGSIPLYGSPDAAYPNADYKQYRYSLSDGITDVALIDGCIMMTSYDLPWEEKLLKGWHFYDAFQSMNFLLHGYRIVVPTPKLPWFLHDDGIFLSLWDYHDYRKIFVEKYAPYLGKSYSQIRKET